MPIMMPVPMPNMRMAVPFPLTGAMLPGRVNMVQHPLVQQNFLLMQQAQYRPPTHQLQHQQQMISNMQMQQRFPYHRVNYANNAPPGNRMPLPPSEARRGPVDEYAGFMSQKEREWLVKIQKLQLESSITDPYVEDYYAMCYNSKVSDSLLFPLSLVP